MTAGSAGMVLRCSGVWPLLSFTMALAPACSSGCTKASSPVSAAVPIVSGRARGLRRTGSVQRRLLVLVDNRDLGLELHQELARVVMELWRAAQDAHLEARQPARCDGVVERRLAVCIARVQLRLVLQQERREAPRIPGRRGVENAHVGAAGRPRDGRQLGE